MNIEMFLLASLLKGLLGIGLLALGYYVIDKITGLGFKKALKNEKITGADLFVCSLVLGLCLVIALGVL